MLTFYAGAFVFMGPWPFAHHATLLVPTYVTGLALNMYHNISKYFKYSDCI